MKIILGVTGSVAAKLTHKLVAAIHDQYPDSELEVVATQRGLYFFDRRTIESYGVSVLTDKDEWPEDGYAKGKPVPHIDLGEWADILLIAPLTADTLSDMAHGKADKFLTSIVLAWPRNKRMILAPAMNTRMWENPITKMNLGIVRRTYHAHVIEPVEGNLACGTTGVGAMAQINTIVAAIA